MSANSARAETAAAMLQLLDLPGLGPLRALRLVDKYGSAHAALDAVAGGDTGGDTARDALLTSNPETYAAVISKTTELGGEFVLWYEAGYPENLSKWDARPPVLFYKGDISGVGRRALALVGRVDPTGGGVDAARRFARLCVDADIQVVSGLAKGIDGASHHAALKEPPGSTFAVLGHGLDFSYPAENRDLYEAIPSHGALITQFPTGFGPQRWTFPARNEVMCTLALGTVIVEGKTGCGSIIQADFSFKHGRPVFILSRNLRGDDTAWAEALVQRGAHVVERFEQVLEVVETTMADLWGPRSVQGSLLDDAVVAEQAPWAALFDLDGVLVDSRAATAKSLADIASRHTGTTVTADSVDLAAKPWGELKRLGVADGWEAYKAEYDTAFGSNVSEIVVFKAVADAIRQARNAGVHTAAITAQPRRRVEKMLPPEYAELFDHVLTYEDTKGKKPAGIASALKRLGVDPSHACYIGDTAGDVDAAKQSGVAAVAVGWGFTRLDDLTLASPDVTVQAPEDLADALTAWRAAPV